MSCILLASFEGKTVEFEEQNPHHKTGPFVAVDKRMIAHNARSVESSHLDSVLRGSIRTVLTGASQGGSQESFIAQSRCPTVRSQEAVVDRKNIALLNPDRFFFSSHGETVTLPGRSKYYDTGP